MNPYSKSCMHHAETKTHKDTDLNFDFEIFWLKERRTSKFTKEGCSRGLLGIEDVQLQKSTEL